MVLRIFLLAGLVLLAACADPAPPGPATAAERSLDGRYAGTVTSISPPTCGLPGGAVLITLSGGALSMRIGGNQITGRVDGAGQISQVNLASTSFSGSATGSGRVADGRITLQLQTFRTGGYVPCSFTYAATKAT
jgi:hypothetical protein